MADYGAQDTSTTTLGANQFPIAENWTPNAGFSAVEGGPQSTDAGGKKSAPVSVYAKDGSNVTQGAQADAAYTDGTGAASGTSMGLFKGIFVKLAAIATAIVGTLKVKGDFSEQASLSAGSLNADLVPATDVSNYKSLSLQINGNAYSGTLTFQWSNDGTNYYPLFMNRIDNNSSNSASTTALTAVGFGVNVFFHYFRVRMTSYTSGAAQGTLDLFTLPMYFQTTIAQAGTWTVQPGNTPNTTPWLMAGPNANGTQAANSAANTVIKGSSGWLYHAIITTLGTAGLTIYDNASTNSGTPLLVIPASAAVGTIYSFPSGARAVNGITSAGVTNCPAVTFHYT